MHHHHRMYYGISRDELLSLAGDRKRMKFKDIRDKKKDVNAPPADRIPLPSLSENIKIERRMAYRDALTKKVRTPGFIFLLNYSNARIFIRFVTEKNY